MRFSEQSFFENKEKDDQREQNDHGDVVSYHEISHLLSHRFPVSPESMAHENPDQIPCRAAQEREDRHREDSETGYSCSQRNGGTDPRHESIEEDQEISVPPKPFLGFDNVFCPKESEIPLNEEMSSQEPPDPEEGQKTEKAPDRRGDVHSGKTQLPHPDQKGSESRDRVTGDGGHQIFYESAQS